MDFKKTAEKLFKAYNRMEPFFWKIVIDTEGYQWYTNSHVFLTTREITDTRPIEIKENIALTKHGLDNIAKEWAKYHKVLPSQLIEEYPIDKELRDYISVFKPSKKNEIIVSFKDNHVLVYEKDDYDLNGEGSMLMKYERRNIPEDVAFLGFYFDIVKPEFLYYTDKPSYAFKTKDFWGLIMPRKENG